MANIRIEYSIVFDENTATEKDIANAIHNVVDAVIHSAVRVKGFVAGGVRVEMDNEPEEEADRAEE
jgi:hypothetical protein